MSSQPQIQANRLNALKSTGPKTPQGKATVSQNALKHGLSARHDVVITDNQADFDLHRDSLLTELAPNHPPFSRSLIPARRETCAGGHHRTKQDPHPEQNKFQTRTRSRRGVLPK